MFKVIICGLGAVGMTLGAKFLQSGCDLRILADSERLKKYQKNKPIYNGIEQEFKYIFPAENFEADLIIVSTKAFGLKDAISQIKNFVGKETRIISLINGVSSEEEILSVYPNAKVIKSYFIGHSAVRVGNSVTQDGIYTITIGKDEILENILKTCGINYKAEEDIEYSLWRKFALNMFSNPVSAILNMTFGELRSNANFIDFAKNICSEIRLIAEKKGVKNLENLEKDAIDSLKLMCEDGKTSMLQDVLAGRSTENEIFAGEMVRLGKKYGISVPYSTVLYELVKILEEKNEHSIHSR